MKRFLAGVVFLTCLVANAADAPAPFRVAIVGLDHGHVDGVLADTLKRTDVQLVGVVEPKAALAAEFAERFHIPAALQFSDLERMLDTAKPEGVMVFTSTFAHAEVVAKCAARGVHVMMEKPLAVSMEHARAMQAAAREHSIHVLVNYETTWYPSHELAYTLARRQGAIGGLRKFVVRDGHNGPKEIGCPESFLVWLTDPVLNGGGALTDFGCYGADLITWLMDGERPVRVTAVTHQFKPEVYPRVDDDATIVVTYPHAEGLIQASWNWPIGRKDMDIYGVTGAIEVADRNTLRLRSTRGEAQDLKPAPLVSPLNEPVAYFAAVVRGEIPEHPLSSLATNMTVTEILDAARESARTGRSVDLRARNDDASPPTNPTMITQSTYLLLDGNCAQAMRFYQECLGGELTMTTVGESPMKAMFPESMHARVVNAKLTSGPVSINASDWLRPNEKRVQGNTVCIYISGGSVAETKAIFERLSRGSDVTDPFKEQPYGFYGALNDAYGVRWMFHAAKE